MINSKLSGNDVCCLDIETNIWTNSIANFIIFLEILLKGHKKEDIDVNEILLEFLFDYFSKKEVMPGTSIKEWIDRYNKKTETYEGYPVRIYPLETMLLEDKTERLVVSSVKEELDGFEKTVNFFNDGTWDDVKAILKNENIKVSIETFDEVTEFNNLIDLWFRVKFIEDEKEKMKVEFSKDRGYKFSIEFEDLDSLMSLSYDNNEIERLLNCVDISNSIGKRDYLILSLLVYLGLRISDIIDLKLSDINWNLNTINIVQQKTKTTLILPLIDEVKYPLLDYLKNVRKNVNDDYIFITNYAPIGKYNSKSFQTIVTKYMNKANIDYTNKHHGTHSLRHSLAINLLKENIPITTISSVLGHSTIKTTRQYLTIDVSNLKELSLEVTL